MPSFRSASTSGSTTACIAVSEGYAYDVIMWASDFPHERDQFGGDLPHLKARKDLSDEFKRKMLYDNPVRFYRFSEGDIAAARKAKAN